MSDAGAAVPTGCYKCGRPGHWSRDCPSAPSNANPNPSPNSASTTYPKSSNNFTTPSTNFTKSGHGSSFDHKHSVTAQKPKKTPRSRPKLTPELLLSDEGLGYILRYFPRNFKYRGRGHEVNDLRNLLHMYADWHSQFLPYFPFDQFIHKVEEVGSSKRVRNCIVELKERVAHGGDPTKLKESATENETLHEKADVMNSEEPTHNQEDLAFEGDDLAFETNDADDMQEDVLNEIYHNTVEDTSQTVKANMVNAYTPPNDKLVKVSDSVGVSSNPNNKVTEEQKATMEAKRLKALERAASRSRLLPTS